MGASLFRSGIVRIGRRDCRAIPDHNRRPWNHILITAFVVIVVGGMGSLLGTVVASLLIGELQSFGVLLFPKFSMALIFLLMAVVLMTF